MLVLRRFLISLVAVILVWRIAAVGMSTHYAELLEEGDEDAASKALIWNGRQPEALLHQARVSSERDPETAADLLAQAYDANPAAPWPLMAMASLVQGDQARSESLVTTAVNLAPSDPRIHNRAAAYWISRDNLGQAMRHWSLAMEAYPASKRQLFPILLEAAEDPRARSAFKPFAESPPAWWEAFFESVASKVWDLDTVRALYAFRRESSRAPITEPERQAYVARLKKDGIVVEAYIHWINGLTREQRGRLGLIYDGGFELEPSNWGFDWRLRSTPTTIVNRAHTYGVDGHSALHLVFKDHNKGFRGVAQALFLAPGLYRVTGKVRTDRLQTEGGLKWLVRCLQPTAKVLGESDRFLGSNEWEEFAFELEVPASCVLQELLLVSAGTRAFERKTTGEVWFDRLAIRQISKLARATNAELTGIVSRNTPKNEGGKQHESFPVSDQPSEEEGGAESAQRDSPINSTANDTSIPTDNASAPKTETRP